MRCIGYCSASSFDLPRLLTFSQGIGSAQLYRDVIHVQIKEERKTKGDIFYFSFGAIVCWGFTEEEEKLILTGVKEFEREPNPKLEIDEFSYRYGESMKIEEDEIVLPNKNILSKLAVSHGIAQSVKLTIFEELVQKTIDGTKHLPSTLAQKGKIPLSRKEISKKMGELFMERNFVNLHSEILDTPEFFWNYPELEPFYRKTAHYLDAGKRVEVLNKRLAVIHELFEILSGEINHQHSARLEWTIIVLIIIEVLLSTLRDIFHIL